MTPVCLGIMSGKTDMAVSKCRESWAVSAREGRARAPIKGLGNLICAAAHVLASTRLAQYRMPSDTAL